MSDNPQLQNITKAEFESYLSVKMPNLKCPGCGEDKFDILVKQNLVDAAQVHFMMGFMGYMPTLAAICENCGYVNSVFWRPVFDWLTANKDGGSADGI